MNRRALAFVLVLALSPMAWGETSEKTPFGDLSIGFSLGQYDNDFGFGVKIASPYFLWDRLSIVAEADYALKRGSLVGDPTSSLTMPYWSFKLGTIGIGAFLGDDIRLYGFGGAFLILPDARFDAVSYVIGGYGGFGFEFLIPISEAFGMSYYIELGSYGSNAKAELLYGQPNYACGFAITTGLKVYF